MTTITKPTEILHFCHWNITVVQNSEYYVMSSAGLSDRGFDQCSQRECNCARLHFLLQEIFAIFQHDIRASWTSMHLAVITIDRFCTDFTSQMNLVSKSEVEHTQ